MQEEKKIRLRVTESQYQEILEIAKMLDRHPSEFMRKAILAQIEQIKKPKHSKQKKPLI